jgi:hypothetical protein
MYNPDILSSLDKASTFATVIVAGAFLNAKALTKPQQFPQNIT